MTDVPSADVPVADVPVADVVVRRATVVDAWEVAVCQSRCWEETYRGTVSEAYLDRVGPVQRLSRWRANIRAGGRVWIAVAGVDVVGVVRAGPARDEPPVRPWELMSLYTRASVHGTGVGGRLLEAAIGTEPASLWVFEGNARAIAFYRRHGFEPDGATAFDVYTGVGEIRLVR